MNPSTIIHSPDSVIGFAGELDASDVAAIRRLVLPLVQGTRDVQLDFSGVTFLDCAVLGVLVELSTAARAGGGALQVVGLRPRPAALVRFFGSGAALGVASSAGSGTGELKAVFATSRREVGV